MKKNHNVLLSLGFLFSLSLLIANDHFLKYQFSNWWTGKLSDFAGLFIFPLFFGFLFPKFKKTIYCFTALGFLWWKSSLANGFIEFWNDVMFYSVHRVVDYSDYLALLILPLSYVYQPKFVIPPKKWAVNFIGILTFVTICATSRGDYEEAEETEFYIRQTALISCTEDKKTCIKEVGKFNNTKTYILTDSTGKPKNINNYSKIAIFTDSLLLIGNGGYTTESGRYVGGVLGLMTYDGIVLIEPDSFKTIRKLNDNLFVAEKEYKGEVLINGKGKIIIAGGAASFKKFYSDNYKYENNFHKHYLFLDTAQIGSLDSLGKEITTPYYNGKRQFKEFRINSFYYSGLIDSLGNVFVQPCYDDIDPFEKKSELLISQRGNYKGLINPTKGIIVPPIYDSIVRLKEDVIIITKGKNTATVRIGLLNNQGETIYPAVINEIDMSEEEVRVRIGEKIKKLSELDLKVRY